MSVSSGNGRKRKNGQEEKDSQSSASLRCEEGREEGRQESREEGCQEGDQEGREEGDQEGREEGDQEGRQESREEGCQEGDQEGREEGDQEGREEALEDVSQQETRAGREEVGCGQAKQVQEGDEVGQLSNQLGGKGDLQSLDDCGEACLVDMSADKDKDEEAKIREAAKALLDDKFAASAALSTQTRAMSLGVIGMVWLITSGMQPSLLTMFSSYTALLISIGSIAVIALLFDGAHAISALISSESSIDRAEIADFASQVHHDHESWSYKWAFRFFVLKICAAAISVLCLLFVVACALITRTESTANLNSSDKPPAQFNVLIALPEKCVPSADTNQEKL